MNKRKVLIAIIMVIICIVLALGGLLLVSDISSNKPIENKEEFSIDINKIDELKNRNEYYDVSKCVYRYFASIRETDTVSLMDILDKDYINEFNITENNIYKYTLENKSSNLHYYIKDIYYKYNSNITQYVVKCRVLNNTTEEDIYLIILFDSVNTSFSVLPVNEKYEDIEELELKSDVTNIEKNEHNTFIYNSIGDETMCKYLLEDYINKVLYFPHDAYNSLDEEYKDERFENYENFEDYIEENKNRLEVSDINSIKQPSEFSRQEEYTEYLEGLDRIYITKYSVENDSENKRYICLDNFGNYYIFTEKSMMNYTLKLDTYTIESDKFKKTYEEGNNQRKVQLNIDKFIKMLNNKDYIHAYEVLDDNFKNNYFKSEEDFKKYIKNNFLEYSNIEFENYKEEGEVFIYQIVLFDKLSRSDKKLRMNIIMKLNEGTDFVMSFGAVN